MKKLIEKHLQGKKILFLFLLTNLVYVYMLFISIPKVMSYSKGMDILDMRPIGYAPFLVEMLFDNLGEQGRAAYLWSQIPIDMIYPLLFGISYCLLLAFLFKRLNKLHKPVFYLAYLPVLAGFFDYLENIGIIILLRNYPPVSSSLVNTTSLFTLLKSGFTTIYFVVLIITLIIFVFTFLMEKFNTNQK